MNLGWRGNFPFRVMHIRAAKPIALATLTGGVRCVAGDEIAQRVVERRAQPDRWRTLAFATFGFGWCGIAQYAIYSKLIPAAARSITRAGLWKAGWPTELAIETLCTNVALYYPVFYFVHASVRAKSLVPPGQVYDKWRANILEDALSCASFWVPANAINFKFVPVSYRASYINFVGVVWLIILSRMRGNDGEGTVPASKRKGIDKIPRRHMFADDQ